MTRTTALTTLFLAIAGLSGCGGDGAASGDPGANTQEVQENRGAEELRPFFESVAETGTVAYSELMGIEQSLEKLGKPELMEEVNRMASSRPDQAKQIAQSILEKL